jgi:hypothetical protein
MGQNDKQMPRHMRVGFYTFVFFSSFQIKGQFPLVVRMNRHGGIMKRLPIDKNDRLATFISKR